MNTKLPLEVDLMEALRHLPEYEETENEGFAVRLSQLPYDGWYDGCNVPVLFEKSRNGALTETWMSPTPFELYHMFVDAINVYGNVLVGGLGLGIASIFMAEQDDVESITIVERSSDLINLMSGYVESDKVSIVCDTLENHCGQLVSDGTIPYDTAAIDIWRSIFESFTEAHRSHGLVSLVLTANDGLRVWGQSVFGQIKVYAPIIASLAVDNSQVVTEPCFTCGRLPRADYAGVCNDCYHYFRSNQQELTSWKWPL